MTDIDCTADIEVSRGFAQVTVRIPLTGHVNEEWLSHFTNLARMWAAREGNTFPRHGEGVIEAQNLPDDRSWIVIRLPAALDRAGIHSVLNTAREMIAQADAAEQVPHAAETEASVREWWASSQVDAWRRPLGCCPSSRRVGNNLARACCCWGSLRFSAAASRPPAPCKGMAPYPGQARCLALGFWPECFRRLNVKGGRRQFPEKTRSALDIEGKHVTIQGPSPGSEPSQGSCTLRAEP